MTKRKAILIGTTAVAVITAVIAAFFICSNDWHNGKSISAINKELSEMQFGEYPNLNFLCEPPSQQLDEVTAEYPSGLRGDVSEKELAEAHLHMERCSVFAEYRDDIKRQYVLSEKEFEALLID